MGPRLAKKHFKNFRVNSGARTTPQPVIVGSSSPETSDDFCGVNFRYFQQKHQCLSHWQKEELKALATWIVKQAARTVPQITSTTKTCHAHQGKKRSLPADVSPDVRLYGLDVTGGARVHGFFTSNTFFLVWLDRDHAIHQ